MSITVSDRGRALGDAGFVLGVDAVS